MRAPLRPGARALALLVPAMLLVGSLVLADGPRVVILGPSLSNPIVTRVRDELAVLGFDVRVEVAADAGDLAAVARRANAAAAARIASAPQAIELWVDPGTAGAPAPAETLREPREPALLALRAVELLRARLLPVPRIERPALAADAAAPPAPAIAADAGPITPPPSDARAHPAPPDRGPFTMVPQAAPNPAPMRGAFALLAGPALLLSPGGVPAAFHVRLGAEWNPLPRLGVDALAYVPVTESAASAAEGMVELRVLEVGGGIRGTLTDPLSDLTVALGLGLSAMMLRFEGHGGAGYMTQSGTRWAASPYAAASAAYRFHPRLAVRFDLLASLVRPEPVLRVAGHDVASFGQPAIFSSLALEVRP